MYQPPKFREDRVAVLHDLIRAHPLALLVTAGPGGLVANPLPLLVDGDGTTPGVLRGHLARVNPQVAELAAVDDCLVVFQGPQAYVTPSWYATKRATGKVVPTWNYATVQARGRPRVIEDAAWLRRQVGDLTDAHEADRPEPWAVSDAPEDFIRSQLNGIVGVEIVLTAIEGKWKMSQNRPAADRTGVIAGLRARAAAGDPMAGAVADLVAARDPDRRS
jgi:transcriptional regulator